MIAYGSNEMAASPHATQMERQERAETGRLHHKVLLRLKLLETGTTFDVFIFICIK